MYSVVYILHLLYIYSQYCIYYNIVNNFFIIIRPYIQNLSGFLLQIKYYLIGLEVYWKPLQAFC